MLALSNFLNKISIFIIYALVLLLPLVFTPFTTEFYDTAKLILTALAVLLLLLVWSIKLFIENKLTIVKTPIDLLLLIYIIGAILSGVLSSSPYLSLYGQLPRVYGSLLFQIVTVLLYFMVVSNLKGMRQIATTINLMIISGLLLALVTLISYFKQFIPFNLAGSSNAAAIFLALLLPIVLSYLLRTAVLKSLVSVFYLISLFLFTITIVLVGNMAAWIVMGVAIGFSLWQNKLVFKGSFGMLLGAALLVITTAILSYTPTIKSLTPLGKLASDYSREIQLPVSISWKISASAFRDSPILGTGPATYLHNFTAYKPIEYNETSFWNLRISSAHNQYLQTWAELGGAGILILLIIVTTYLFYAFRHKDEFGLWLSGVVFFIGMAFSPMNVLTFISGFLILALFMALLRGRGDHTLTVDLVGRTASEVKGTHILIPSLIFLPLVILILAGVYFFGKLTIGEYYHKQALNAFSKNDGKGAYNHLVSAERINPQIDLYRIDLAQTNFALANAIAAPKGPSEASPGGSLTDNDRQNIKQLLQQSIAEGKAATILSPRSSANWEILALIYRQISGVAPESVNFALDAYGKAIQRDPLNPLLRLAVGGVYYQAKNYDLAIRFFDDAVSLKPDYANALYNLSVALRDKGNTGEATSIAERLVAQLQDKQDTNDYKLASDLLKELKEKAPSATQPNIASPSAALEQQNLPNVVDLGKPEKISTPPAVKK